MSTPGTKVVHIVGGGTVFHVRPHLALSAPAYGGTARLLERLCKEHSDKLEVKLHLTKMASAGAGDLDTNEDVARLMETLVADYATKIVFMPVALVDYSGSVAADQGTAGKYGTRLKTRAFPSVAMDLTAAPKVIGKVREKRKDIFLVGFKTTSGATVDEMYIAGLHLLKESSCNLVFANDVKTRTNMVITPEEARYHVTDNREEALKGLVEMAYLRSHLTFTRSTVIAGESVPWDSPEVPQALKTVVDHCITRGAYKPFRGATVGHFAVKVGPTTFLTSKRKTNFNELSKIGLVKVETDGPDSVLAYGSKPSVGGQSQRIVFAEHPDCDCIVHFHCPIRPGSAVPTVSQREYECGSHQCGENTSRGLKKFGNLHAVYLDQHGPNLVFNRSIDPAELIAFIEANFDLEAKTGGYVNLSASTPNS
jgi:ribulose-5-phosphate 4-epimerase/fuculose-1-phosphate aldolase